MLTKEERDRQAKATGLDAPEATPDGSPVAAAPTSPAVGEADSQQQQPQPQQQQETPPGGQMGAKRRVLITDKKRASQSWKDKKKDLLGKFIKQRSEKDDIMESKGESADITAEDQPVTLHLGPLKAITKHLLDHGNSPPPHPQNKTDLIGYLSIDAHKTEGIFRVNGNALMVKFVWKTFAGPGRSINGLGNA